MAVVVDLLLSIHWWGLARLMDGEQTRHDATLEDLLAAGREALESGDRVTAHEIWRAAAVANPYDERVWVSLLEVLDSDDDREVCLENIIAINPLNPEARRQLRGIKHTLELKEVAEEDAEAAIMPPLDEPTHPVRSLVRAIAHGIFIGALAVALGIGFSALVYGGLFKGVP